MGLDLGDWSLAPEVAKRLAREHKRVVKRCGTQHRRTLGKRHLERYLAGDETVQLDHDTIDRGLCSRELNGYDAECKKKS